MVRIVTVTRRLRSCTATLSSISLVSNVRVMIAVEITVTMNVITMIIVPTVTIDALSSFSEDFDSHAIRVTMVTHRDSIAKPPYTREFLIVQNGLVTITARVADNTADTRMDSKYAKKLTKYKRLGSRWLYKYDMVPVRVNMRSEKFNKNISTRETAKLKRLQK